ncbi:MAG: hypothetical protein RMI91_04365 [Gemmatales bacterium]|nr:hypothetical protein [Gemmatales bacterium]MDW7993869.1 hypothetical protein [Gemmatales bacterium]
MSKLRFVALIFATCALWVPEATAQKQLAQHIIGQWQPVEEDKFTKVLVEFSRDGQLLITINGKSIMGKYRVLSDNEVEVTLDAEGKVVVEKLQVTISNDQMTTIDSKGQKDVFRRAK